MSAYLSSGNCNETDLYFPMTADLYYPIISQGSYGEVKKDWVFDRKIALNAIKGDIRVTSNNNTEALTNILITNISSASGELIYKESAGPRSGRGTIYEIASYDPHFAPYGDIDYYSFTIRRSENQAAQ